MPYSFSNNAQNVSTRQFPAAGIDQEAIHRIRHQGRIERAKVVRRGFAMLKRAIRKRIATTAHIGESIS